MSHPQPRIAIIGGGPAGLTAGVLLHKYRVPFTIFELRHKPTAEDLAQPTGVLDLHEESGLAAIRKCGLYDAFVLLIGDCAQVMRFADRDGNVVLGEEVEQGEERPEISRSALNQLLLANFPADSIRWNHKLISAIRSIASGQTEIELDFGVHGKQIFDFVIGADGAWSKVRKLLTDVGPQFSGRQIITATIRDITKEYPHLVELIGPGTFFALGNRHGVSVQRGSFNSARMYIFITTPDEDFATTSGMSGQTAAFAKEKILGDDALLGHWGAKTKDLVTVACDEEVSYDPEAKVDIRGLYELPLGWEHKVGATLIGDAAHLMPPNGEGVNIAMLDAMKLTEVIIQAYEAASSGEASFQSVLDTLVEEFEVDMMERAKKTAEETVQLGEMLFGEDAVTSMVNFFKSFGKPAE